jgi:hypothetical protein
VRVQILSAKPPFLPRNFKEEVGRTRVHGPISYLSSAMFLFYIVKKFRLENMISTNYKRFSMEKTAQILGPDLNYF